MGDVDFHKKRRRVTKASLTKLSTKLTELESDTANPDALRAAQGLASKLKTLDAEFKTHQLAIIDLTNDDEGLDAEQQELDDHDERVSELTIRIQRLISTLSPSTIDGLTKTSTRRLTRLQEKSAVIQGAVDAIPDDHGDDDSACTLEQYAEQLADVKTELREIQTCLLNVDLAAEDPIMRAQDEIERTIFRCSVAIRKKLRASSDTTTRDTPTPRAAGAKLPRLEVPSFDGDILKWKSFWEQFSASIHKRSDLTAAEKMVYLQNALKDKAAKSTIEGLTKSGEHYEEAVKCLQSRYDRPRMVHQTHVRRIVEASSLKDGTGKELRTLHDTVVQHLRALKALGHEPSKEFITSLLELKLDPVTMFEWQRHSQEHNDVPDCEKLLEFIDLRAQAAEATVVEKKPRSSHPPPSNKSKPIPALAASTKEAEGKCIACKSEKHPLYSCSKFRSMSHDEMVDLLKLHGHCLNCLRHGHFVRDCKSLHRCRTCQRPHHSLLHVDKTPSANLADVPANHASVRIQSNLLLMTCQVLVRSPSGVMQVRALLDSGSSVSFVSERVAQALRLRRSSQVVRICGITGFSLENNNRSITSFKIASVHTPSRQLGVNAVIVPHVTCDLPTHPVPLNPEWEHIKGLRLADPEFGEPGNIDVLLGVETFVDIIRHGRRKGRQSSPTAIETTFGWVLAGNTNIGGSNTVASHHVSVLTGDDLLRQFWDVEEKSVANSTLTPEERTVLHHFDAHHSRDSEGRFLVPLPKRSTATKLGESRAQAVRRFISFERAMHAKGEFEEVHKVIEEYFVNKHAEPVPQVDLEKPPSEVFYLPIHVVRKESSTTTKVRAVFDASAKTSTGISLNDILLVGPTVHTPLVDVLVRFRTYRVALIADVSRMYRAIRLTDADKDLHRFVWRSSPAAPLSDFRMTRVTFGVSSSSFVANMCIKQNAVDFSMEHPNAAKVVSESFYVDDCLTGSNSPEEAVELHRELQALFDKGGFLLRKWNASEPSVLQHIDPDLQDAQQTISISDPESYTKTLGINWNSSTDHFRLTVADLPQVNGMTKRALVSDIAKTFDVLGWYSPTIVKAKILLQLLWSEKIGWDDPVPNTLLEEWLQWRSELHLLSSHDIPRCYYPKEATITFMQLHGFSDASERAYSGVVYLRMEDSNGTVHTSMVMAKTRVAPIKRQTIPRLELCGALVMAQILSQCKDVLKIPIDHIYAWTDSTIVLNWLQGSPRRFKVFVGNRVAQIMELIPPDRWRHVISEENPADCASRGMYPSEILTHTLWWNGPKWLKLDQEQWPKQSGAKSVSYSEEDNELCSATCTTFVQSIPLMSFDRFSTLIRLVRVTAWMIRFVTNCRSKKRNTQVNTNPLSIQELNHATRYWIKVAQEESWAPEIDAVKKGSKLKQTSRILSLNPFIDEFGILRVGGRQESARISFDNQHPIILLSTHPLVKLLIRSEHLRLLHAGHLLTSASLSRQYHIVGGHKAIRSITRNCVVCRKQSARPSPQLMGQLPKERVTPDAVFNNVGLDYAGPVYLKQGSVRKPVVVKAYVCVFVSLSTKAVHIEAVSDLTSEAFIACLKRFISRRGKPTLLWSDHGTNFVGAKRILKELYEFLKESQTNQTIADFCSTQGIQWDFIPERAPHFGGLWESAVKSLKTHLHRIVGNSRLNFEELTTVLSQIEACLNSRPLGVVPHYNDEGVQVLTPGHFLIGRPLEAIPDHDLTYRPISTLRRWHLCEALVRHFWKRWQSEYLISLRKNSKWRKPVKNLEVGDIVVLREDNTMPTQWPIARIVEAHQGRDGLVRVVKLRTKSGVYTRPVTKVALLLPCE